MVFKKIIFQNSLMANAILNFHFDYRHTSLSNNTCLLITTKTNDHQIISLKALGHPYLQIPLYIFGNPSVHTAKILFTVCVSPFCD